MPPSSPASASARSAVPSGLLSSTTRTSMSRVALARMRRRTSAMVADSLYVGRTTRVFISPRRLPPRPDGLSRSRRYDRFVDQPVPGQPPDDSGDHPYAASRGALIGAFLAVVVAGLSWA